VYKKLYIQLELTGTNVVFSEDIIKVVYVRDTNTSLVSVLFYPPLNVL